MYARRAAVVCPSSIRTIQRACTRARHMRIHIACTRNSGVRRAVARMIPTWGVLVTSVSTMVTSLGESCAAPQRDTDFIGDNKLDFVATNWSACCARCSTIRQCHFWTFEGSDTTAGACFLKAASTTPSGHPHTGRVSGAIGAHGGNPTWPRPPTPPPSPPYSPPGLFRCESELDCSLNGRCTSAIDPTRNSTCVCFVGWRGKRCETLDLLPASPQAGYQYRERGANVSSWGMPMLRHPATGVYHAWPAEMTSHCGINSWERNSQVVHATSASPAGTFERIGVVWPVFASEPSVALGQDGEAVMWWSMSPSGTEPPGGDECTNGCTDGQTVPKCNSNYTRGQIFTTYVSWTTNEAWTAWSKPQVIQRGSVTSQDTNMASVVLRDGSVVGLWRSKQHGGIHRVTATHYKIPASYDWHILDRPLFVEAAHPLAPEDPFVWATSVSDMGSANKTWFHALFHHRSCSASWVNRSLSYGTVDCGGLAYSEDGVQWHYADIAGTAYQPVVEWQQTEAVGGKPASSQASSYRFIRRERPHLAFDACGKMVALSNGVVYGWPGQRRDGMHDASYSLVQPIRSF